MARLPRAFPYLRLVFNDDPLLRLNDILRSGPGWQRQGAQSGARRGHGLGDRNLDDLGWRDDRACRTGAQDGRGGNQASPDHSCGSSADPPGRRRPSR